MSDTVLSIAGLRSGYGDEDILHGVDIRVVRGTIVAIIGPNGSGKSTLLKTLYGLVRPRAGTITWRSSATNCGGGVSLATRGL